MVKDFFEKPVVMSQEIILIYEIWMYVHMILPLVRNLSQMNPLQTLQ
jgi:hypothetical protein